MPDTKVVALGRTRPAGAAAPNVLWIESSLEELSPTHWQSAAGSLEAVIRRTHRPQVRERESNLQIAYDELQKKWRLEPHSNAVNAPPARALSLSR